MQGISRNILISAALHSAMLAAVFVLGAGSEHHRRNVFAVSLSDSWDHAFSSPEPRAAVIPSVAGQPRRVVPPPSTPPPSASRQPEDAPSIPAAGPRPSAGGADDPGPVLSTRASTAGGPGGAGSGMPGPLLSSPGIASPAVSGAGGASGGPPAPAGIDPAVRQRIRDALQANLVYPYLARRRQIEGTVHAAFRVSPAGTPLNIRVIRTSNHEILDLAARETIQRSGPYPLVGGDVEVPITFRLR